MPKKIEGYRERDEVYKPLAPKEASKEMNISPASEGGAMSQFRKSMEDHMGEINSGRGNGIPDNYKKKNK